MHYNIQIGFYFNGDLDYFKAIPNYLKMYAHGGWKDLVYLAIQR